MDMQFCQALMLYKAINISFEIDKQLEEGSGKTREELLQNYSTHMLSYLISWGEEMGCQGTEYAAKLTSYCFNKLGVVPGVLWGVVMEATGGLFVTASKGAAQRGPCDAACGRATQALCGPPRGRKGDQRLDDVIP